MAGTIIERRDHVLITLWVPASFCASTFLIRWSSTNGPFFRLRGISLLPLTGLAATDDQGIAGLALARAALGLAPGGDRVTDTGGLALATTVRVVDGVHHDTADGRATALPAHAAGLAPADVRLLGVADLADGGAAAHVHEPHLAGRHAQRGASAFTSDQLGRVAGRPG